MTLEQLCRELDISPTLALRALKNLEQRGLIVATPSGRQDAPGRRVESGATALPADPLDAAARDPTPAPGRISGRSGVPQSRRGRI